MTDENLIYWMKQFYYKYKVQLGNDFVNDMIYQLEHMINTNVVHKSLRFTENYILKFIENIPNSVLSLKTKDAHMYRRESFLYRIKIRQMCKNFYSLFSYAIYRYQEDTHAYWHEMKINKLIKTYRKNELKYREEENTIFNVIQLLRKTSISNDLVEYNIKPYLQRKYIKIRT